MNGKLLVSTLFLAALPLTAATVTYVGYDLTTSGAWRNTGVAKPLDADGNNVYGSDGYLLTTSPGGALLSNPSYASVLNLVSAFYSGHVTTPNYTTVDNPLGGTVKTGIWYATGAFANQEQDFVRITVSQASSFRIGILVDETDFIGISPGQLRVRQTAGGSGDSTLVNAMVEATVDRFPGRDGRRGDSTLVNAMVEANLDTDWYFFDILGAQAGDQFVISGTDSRVGAGPVASNGIGAISFDSVAVPEASTNMVGLLAVGALALRWRSAARAS